MPDYSMEKDLDDLDTSSYKIVTYTSPVEGLGVISLLLHFDHKQSQRPFSEVINEINGCVSGGNYIVVVRKVKDKLQPVAFLGWNFLDEYSLVLKANNIRQLAPSEATRGNIPLLSFFSSPFSSPHQMMEFMQEKSLKLQELGEIAVLDNLFGQGDT